MIRFPNCKINLGLNILERLPDGYHGIATLFYPIGLSDILEINASSGKETRLTVSGIALPGDPKDNLCFRAWNILHEECGIPAVEMHLHKLIPAGAGLGGGSSDAAQTLMILNELFLLGLGHEKLALRATQLGMDCTFFLLNKPAIGEGRGEILNPFAKVLTGKFIVLVKPEVHVSTAEAYAGVVPFKSHIHIGDVLNTPIEAWKDQLENDFEKSVFQKFPDIGRIKEELYSNGAVYASMSGSGSAVYGIFNEKVNLSSLFNGCFVWQDFV
ncbi:MAG: 4-(cytidine 5'-diphospho)-2-C-methyl-D-erythritol kinase [Bacteroidetes bacterium]|nr:4-(cytidine 5'-diphospho)-2-C-methyl-D-erythritol kinase [Bacteroidota bacterium]